MASSRVYASNMILLDKAKLDVKGRLIPIK